MESVLWSYPEGGGRRKNWKWSPATILYLLGHLNLIVCIQMWSCWSIEKQKTFMAGQNCWAQSLHIIIIIIQWSAYVCRGLNVKSIIIIIVKVISSSNLISLSQIRAMVQCTVQCELEREFFNSLYFKRSFWFFYFVNWDKFALVHLILYKIEIEISIFSISYLNTLHIL